MKRLFLVFIVFIYSQFTYTYSALPSYLDQQRELVIQFEGTNVKDVANIQNLILGIDGLSYVSYCEKYNVFLITYDNTVFISDDYAIKAITNSNDKLRPLKMEGASHGQINSNCQ